MLTASVGRRRGGDGGGRVQRVRGNCEVQPQVARGPRVPPEGASSYPQGIFRVLGSRPDALHALVTGFELRPQVDVELGALPAASAQARTGHIAIKDSALSVTVSGTILYSF